MHKHLPLFQRDFFFESAFQKSSSGNAILVFNIVIVRFVFTIASTCQRFFLIGQEIISKDKLSLSLSRLSLLIPLTGEQWFE